MNEFVHKFIDTNGIKMHVVEAGFLEIHRVGSALRVTRVVASDAVFIKERTIGFGFRPWGCRWCDCRRGLRPRGSALRE